MIRAKIEGDPPGWIFGLSAGNIRLLQEGRHIVFDFGDVGGPPGSTIIICYAETEDALTADLKRAGWDMPNVIDNRKKT